MLYTQYQITHIIAVIYFLQLRRCRILPSKGNLQVTISIHELLFHQCWYHVIHTRHCVQILVLKIDSLNVQALLRIALIGSCYRKTLLTLFNKHIIYARHTLLIRRIYAVVCRLKATSVGRITDLSLGGCLNINKFVLITHSIL